jgi:FkbH-like protein
MRRIQDALNLKLKDYVFVDDRGDQLSLVSSALPEILALDATSATTWDLLAAWERMLPKQTEADRTLQYREREAREGFIAALAEEDPSALFANLGIRVTLREAARADLQRVTELINRTNQFNLAGSRTTFGEVGRWHGDPDYRILVVEASDKFGPMGLISVAILQRDGESLRILAFVLSCRVFGYGIEKAVINLAKRLALSEGGDGPLTILGAYKETSHNAPCRTAYPDNGFTWDDSCWSFKGYEIEPDATWLTIDDRVSTQGLAAGRSAASG